MGGGTSVNASRSADHIYKYIDTIARNDQSFQGNKVYQNREVSQPKSISNGTEVRNDGLEKKEAKELKIAEDKINAGVKGSKGDFKALSRAVKEYANEHGGIVPYLVAGMINSSEKFRQYSKKGGKLDHIVQKSINVFEGRDTIDETKVKHEKKKLGDDKAEVKKAKKESTTESENSKISDIKTTEVVGTDISKVHDAKTATEFIKNKGIDNVWDLCDKLTDDEFRILQHATSFEAQLFGNGDGKDRENFEKAINWGNCPSSNFNMTRESKSKILQDAGPRPEVAQEKITAKSLAKDAMQLGGNGSIGKGILDASQAAGLSRWIEEKAASMQGGQEELKGLHHLVFEKMSPTEQRDLGKLAAAYSAIKSKFPEDKEKLMLAKQDINIFIEFSKNISDVERNEYVKLPNDKMRSAYAKFSVRTSEQEKETYLALNPENRGKYMDVINNSRNEDGTQKLTALEKTLLGNMAGIRKPNDNDTEKVKQEVANDLNDKFGKFLDFLVTASPKEKEEIETEIQGYIKGIDDPAEKQIAGETVLNMHIASSGRYESTQAKWQ